MHCLPLYTINISPYQSCQQHSNTMNIRHLLLLSSSENDDKVQKVSTMLSSQYYSSVGGTMYLKKQEIKRGEGEEEGVRGQSF